MVRVKWQMLIMGMLALELEKNTLYKEQTVVEKNIPEEKAVEALINLIKKYGDWVDKKIKLMTFYFKCYIHSFYN